MRFQNPIDAILNSSSKVRILRFLCNKGGEWSGRRGAAELVMNPVTAHRALRELHQATLLDLRKVGNSLVYSLREDHYLVHEALKPLFAREAQAPEKLDQFLQGAIDKKLSRHVVSAAVYGSIVRHQERPTSDVDLLVLVKSDRAKEEVRRILEPLWEKVAWRFGNTLSLYVNTVHEWQQKYRHKLPVIQNILKDHHVIWGIPIEEVLRGHAA